MLVSPHSPRCRLPSFAKGQLVVPVACPLSEGSLLDKSALVDLKILRVYSICLFLRSWLAQIKLGTKSSKYAATFSSSHLWQSTRRFHRNTTTLISLSLALSLYSLPLFEVRHIWLVDAPLRHIMWAGLTLRRSQTDRWETCVKLFTHTTQTSGK